MKHISQILSGLLLIAAAAVQCADYPASGLIKLQSGDYEVSLLAGKAWTLSGIACRGKQLFVSESSSAGTAINPDAAEKLNDLSVSVDGKAVTPSARLYKGASVTVTRETRFGDFLEMKNTLTLTPQGLDVGLSFRRTKENKIKYFYLYTLPWATGFQEFKAQLAGKEVPGKLTGSGKWLINGDLRWYGIYDPARQLGAAVGVPMAVPTEIRRHTIWDHKSYHKYFLFAKPPTDELWSHDYHLLIRAFNAAPGEWEKALADTVKAMELPAQSEKKNNRVLNRVKVVPPGKITGRTDWETNRRGISALDPDDVLPPFEPVKADQDGASVWNRRYQIGTAGLPDKVLIAGKDIFSRPMTLNAVIDGKRVVFKEESRKLLSSYRGRAVYEVKMSSEAADLTTLVTIEYDGMYRVDLTLAPKKKLSLDHFDYAFHLPREKALYTHFIGNPPQNGLSIMIPAQSCSFAVPEKDGVFFREPFKTLVWFGDNDQGFLWFSGSEQHFNPQEAEKRPAALTAAAAGKEVTFQVAPVTKAYCIDKPVTYTFGFFATPVRPMPEKWRSWLFTTRRAAYGSECSHGVVGSEPMIWPDEYRSTAAPRLSQESEDKIAKYAAKLHKKGKLALGYVDPIRVHFGYLRYLDQKFTGKQLNDLYLGSEKGDSDAFLHRVPMLAKNMKNWQTLPEMIYAYGARSGGREVRVSSKSSWADFFCFMMECYAKLGMDGMGDIDNCFPIRDMNGLHGAGYIDQNGVRRCTWDWFERRDLMKRVAKTFLEARNGKPALLIAHASATWSIPFISFCDGNMTFEHSNSGYYLSSSILSKYCSDNAKINADMKNGCRTFLEYAFPPARWRAELTGRQFGLPVIIMSNLTKSPKIDPAWAKSETAARDLTAFMLAHDCTYWPIWCNTKPIVKAWQIKEEFGISDPAVEFTPYWAKEHPVAASAPELSVSLYTKPDSALVALSNLTGDAVTGTLDLSKIGAKSVIDAETSTAVAMEQGKITVSLPRRDFKMFKVTR